MRISVALCTYNGALYLPDLLGSIARQTRLPDEMVVCDDVSSDESKQILDDFAKQASFVVNIVHNEKNLGSTYNFAQAIRLCKGDVIALCDQDDVWYPQKLEKFEQALIASPGAGLVASNLALVQSDLSPMNETMWQQLGLTTELRNRLEGHQAFSALLKKNYITGAAMAFKADFRDIILPIPSSWVHDQWIAILISAMAFIVLIDQPLVDYRQHETNQIGAYQESYFIRAVKALSIPAEAYNDEVERFLQLKQRLGKMLDTTRYQELCPNLDEKINHIEKRANLPTNRLARVPSIIFELLARRYHKYSINGFGSAARDMLASR